MAASKKQKTPISRNSSSRASASSGVSGMLTDLKTDFITTMTPIAKAQARTMSNSGKEKIHTSILTKALNVFDAYSHHLSVSVSLGGGRYSVAHALTDIPPSAQWYIGQGMGS